MSLTSLLKQRDVRERFKAEFVKPRIALSRGNAFVPPSPTKHYALIGTAFDYVARLHAANINQNARCGIWVADEAVGKLKMALAIGRPVFAPDVERSTRGLLKLARGIVDAARREYEHCVVARDVSDKILWDALLLAQLDAYYRCGMLGRDFGKVNELDVADLRQLLAVLRGPSTNNFMASRVCVLNPTFGEGSAMVSGADADLLVDDTLIELKTTKELEFSADTFRQLMGYYTLSRIGQISGDVKSMPVIRNIAMYSSRYGVFHKIGVDYLINPKTFPKFMRWLKRRAMYGPTARVRTMQFADGVTVHF